MFNKFYAEGRLEGNDLSLMKQCYEPIAGEIFTQANVVVTTIANSADGLLLENFEEHLVIHLEAGKVALETLIGLAFHPQPTILRGDRMQLRPFQRDEDSSRPLRKQWNRSLMEGWIDMGYKTTTLTQQHRSLPQICNMVSKSFYDGAMVSMPL
jgi:hypothetical protein